MGNMREEIVRSLKLNKDLAKMLKQGIELNKPIKIGWACWLGSQGAALREGA